MLIIERHVINSITKQFHATQKTRKLLFEITTHSELSPDQYNYEIFSIFHSTIRHLQIRFW